MPKNKILNSIIDYIHRFDKVMFIIISFISVLSLLLLKSVSRASSIDSFKTQLFAIILGVAIVFVITHIDYGTIANFWFVIACFCLFLMIYTSFFGVNVSGGGGVNATAWITIAGMSFQPSELVKICFLITFAKHIEILTEKNILNHPLQVVFLATHALVPVVLCHMQGDDGTGIVFVAMFLFMSFAAGVKPVYFIILAVIIVVSIPVLWEFVLSDYQKARFTSVYNLDDPTVAISTGYQQYQGRISIGSGGFFGAGLFNGASVESAVVTYQRNDFIFSLVGEELGFAGCMVVIFSLIAVMWRSLYVASVARDVVGKIICYGFCGLIALQTISNIGMCLALLPVMGVTLPFYSAGGSSIICLYLGLGLLQSIYMHKDYIGGVKLRYKTSNELRYYDLKNIDL